MTSLLSRWVRRKTPVPAIPVTVYTRKECGCCHKAIEFLNRVGRKENLAIELVDVDSDPLLAHDYGPSVPVVAIDGKVRFRGVVDPILLQRILDHRDST